MNKKYVELIKQVSDKDLLISLYITQILLLTFAFLLGIFLFDSYSAFFNLFKWDDPDILVIGGTAGLVVVIVDVILMKILPSSFYDDGGLNERIFQKRSAFHIAVIAAVVAIGEEVFFRGVIQTHFGLLISSLLFALVHFRYLFHWYLVMNVIGLSFFIGFIYLQTENLLVTIMMHFLIDFILGYKMKYKFKKNQNEQEGIFDE